MRYREKLSTPISPLQKLRNCLGALFRNEEIVGAVSNVRFPANPAELKAPFQTDRPLAQEPRTRLALAVRGTLSGEAVRRAVAQLDPDQPVSDAGPTRARVGNSRDNWAVGGHLLITFALLGVSLILMSVTFLACWLPARRAARVDPMVALRSE